MKKSGIKFKQIHKSKYFVPGLLVVAAVLFFGYATVLRIQNENYSEAHGQAKSAANPNSPVLVSTDGFNTGIADYLSF